MGIDEEKQLTLEADKSEQKLPIENLSTKQQRFIHLYMTGQYTVNKLAQLLEVHPNTLHKWLKRPDVREIISDMQTSNQELVANQIKLLTIQATNKLAELINSPIDGVALQAVKDVLDRAGHKPKQEIKKDITVRSFEEKLNDIIEKTIDVEYEVSDDE